MQLQTVSLAEDKDNFEAICGDALGAGIPAASAVVGAGTMFIPGSKSSGCSYNGLYINIFWKFSGTARG